MGGNHSQDFDEDLFRSHWERKQGHPFEGRTIWKNKSQPSTEIEEFPIYADTEDDIELQRSLFALRKDSRQLVAASYFKETVKAGFCSSVAQGRLFLERIPLKLQALQHIPFPDILHLHFNALTGYKKLNDAVGPFRPQSEQIGFNNSGEAKVWLNSDFSVCYPSSKQVSQFAMVRNLLQLIEDVTDTNTTPRENPSILNYVYRNRNDVSFDLALNSIKEYANQYNGGMISRNLDCLLRNGIERISQTLIGGPAQSFNQPQFNSQRTAFNTVPQQPLIINSGNVEQRNPVVLSTVTTYPAATNLVQTSIVQPVQFNRPLPVSQQVQPLIVGQNVQPVQVVQPVGILGVSGVRGSQVNFNQPIQVPQPVVQSNFQTVRPPQAVFVKQVQNQRVIQQVVRSPQGPIQIIPQGQFVQQPVSEGFVYRQTQVTQLPVIQQQPVIVQGGQVRFVGQNQGQNGSQINQAPQIVQNPEPRIAHCLPGTIPFQYQTTQVVYYSDSNAQNQAVPTSQEQTTTSSQQLNQTGQALNSQQAKQFSMPQTSPQEVLLETQNVFISNSQTVNATQEFTQYNYQKTTVTEVNVDDYLPRSRNFIDSNTMSVGIDKAVTKEYESYNSSADKFNTGLNFEPSTSRYKDIGLDDGKSSEALLAELKNFSSSRKDIPYTTNSYDYSSTSYLKSNSNETPLYTNNYQTYTSTDQNNDLYSTFNKYSKGESLEDNLEMKYSMTKNLYDQPQTGSYEYESSGQAQVSTTFQNAHEEYSQDLDNYQQEGEYHVDFDPEILADIQRIKD